MMRPLRRALLALAVCANADGFYLPGVAPHEYAEGERVDIKVNKLSSTKTQVCRDARSALMRCLLCGMRTFNFTRPSASHARAPAA